jgi:hypothetical protein
VRIKKCLKIKTPMSPSLFPGKMATSKAVSEAEKSAIRERQVIKRLYGCRPSFVATRPSK